MKPEVVIQKKKTEDKVLGHFSFSMTGDSKEQGYSMCPDFAKCEIPKQQTLGHFSISTIESS
jgi:hypothetical protein